MDIAFYENRNAKGQIMGKNLVIKFKTNNELLGSLYFHYSGHTEYSIEKVKFLIKKLGQVFPKNKKEMGEFFIRSGYEWNFDDKKHVQNMIWLTGNTKGIRARPCGIFVLSDLAIRDLWTRLNSGVEINLRTGEIDCSYLLGHGRYLYEYIESYSDDDGYFAGIEFKRIDSMDFFKTTIKEFDEWSKALMQILRDRDILLTTEGKVFRLVC